MTSVRSPWVPGTAALLLAAASLGRANAGGATTSVTGAQAVVMADGIAVADGPWIVNGGNRDQAAELRLGGRVQALGGWWLRSNPDHRRLIASALPGARVEVAGSDFRVAWNTNPPAASLSGVWLDLSAAESLKVRVGRLHVGVDRVSGGDYHSAGALLLPPRAEIVASNEVVVSEHATHVNWCSPPGVLVLGSGTNTIATPRFLVGSRNEAYGIVCFTPRGGTLVLDNGTGRTDVVIGSAEAATSRTRWGEFDASAGSLQARLGTLTIAKSANSRVKYSDSRAWGRFTMGGGALDATGIVLADFAEASAHGPGGWANFLGGTVKLGAGGLVIGRGGSPRHHPSKPTPIMADVVAADTTFEFRGAGIACASGPDVLARLFVYPGTVLNLNGESVSTGLVTFAMEGGTIRDAARIGSAPTISGGVRIDVTGARTTRLDRAPRRVGAGTLAVGVAEGRVVCGERLPAENGMLAPWLVLAGAASADFAAQEATADGFRFVAARYTNVDFQPAPTNHDVVRLSAGARIKLAANSRVHALKCSGYLEAPIIGSSTGGDIEAVLGVGSGGVILDGGEIAGRGQLQFESEQGYVYAAADSTVSACLKAHDLVKFGPARLSLTGFSDMENSVRSVTVNEGILKLTRGETLGSTPVRVASGATVELGGDRFWGDVLLDGGAALRWTHGTNAMSSRIVIRSASTGFDACMLRSDARVVVDGGAVLTVNGKVESDRDQNRASLVKQGSGRLVLTSFNGYLGGTTIEDGELVASAESLPGSVRNEGRLVLDQEGHGVFRGRLSGRGSLVKSGEGALMMLAADGDFAGPVSVNGGTVIAHGNGLGSGTVTVGSGATLVVASRQPGLLGEYYTYTYPVQSHRFAVPDPYMFSNAPRARWSHANLRTLSAALAGSNPQRMGSSAEAGATLFFGEEGSTFDFGREGERFHRPFDQRAFWFETRWTGQFLADEAGEYTFVLNRDNGGLLAIDGRTVIADEDYSTNCRWATVRLGVGWHDIVVSHYEVSGRGYGQWSARTTLSLRYVPPSAQAEETARLAGLRAADPKRVPEPRGRPVPNALLSFNAGAELVLGGLAGDGRVEIGQGKLRLAQARVRDLERRVAQGTIASAWVSADPAGRMLAIEPAAGGAVVSAVKRRN